MATIVCRGLESHLVESRILSLRLPSPKPLTKSCFWESNTKPHGYGHCEESSYKTETVQYNPIFSNQNQNQSGWSSIQALSNVSQGLKEPTYVHPQVKLSSLRLSSKSLELCTENLGNETGTDIIESGIDLLSSSDCDLVTREQRKTRQLYGTKKAKSQNFPPPLTTMRGSESLQVRPHREGGRLVIEVTKVPSSVSCFQAERSHGRLRLCFRTDPEDDDNQGCSEEEEEDDEFETEMNGQKQQDMEEEEEEEEGVDTEIEKEGCSWSNELRMEKYERPKANRRRCKEGDLENNELLVNWGETLWVATS